jgi:hypothetical protein
MSIEYRNGLTYKRNKKSLTKQGSNSAEVICSGRSGRRLQVQTHNRREKHMARAFATSEVERYGRGEEGAQAAS